MNISKDSHNKAATNKRQANWNFTKRNKNCGEIFLHRLQENTKTYSKVKQFIPNTKKTS